MGTLERLVFGNFSPNTTVYFRMKTIDDLGQYVNASAMSNLAAVNTSYDCAGGEGFYGGSGGGGGGLRARRVAEETSAQPMGSGAFVENSLLNGARIGERTTDTYRLGAPPRIESGAYAVRIRVAGAHAAALDAARLLVVDHAPGVTAHGASGAIVLGTRAAAARVTAVDGTDLTASLDGGSEVSAGAGQVLTVDLGPDASGPASSSAPLVIEARGSAAALLSDSAGIVIQAPDDFGGWVTIDHGHPRKDFDEIVVASISSGTVRLVFLSDCGLRFVGRLAPSSEKPAEQWASLLTARSSRLGDTRLAIGAPDNLGATVAGPDTLMLGFSVPPQGEGQVREFFLVADATVLTARSPEIAASRAWTPGIPTRFALRQNQPNPFRAKTTIRFDLPAGAMVRLEVFDVNGRGVRVIADHWFPPGYHSVEWDKRAGGGNQVGPGVYFYRLASGQYREDRRMVLLP